MIADCPGRKGLKLLKSGPVLSRRYDRWLLITIAFILILGSDNPSYGGTFKDALGRSVVLKGKPSRIISLAPSITEILYALGLGRRVVGVTSFSSYPPEAAQKPRVGSYIDLNVEQIISLSPDLVIGTVDGNQPGVVKVLDDAGIRVFILNPRDVRQVIHTVAEIGELCGEKEEGDILVGQLNRRLDRVRQKVASGERPLVFLQINVKPIMTVNKNTFHHDLITLAGGRNMAADEPITYPRISLEEVVRRRPDVILISSMERGGGFQRARQEWFKWPSIPAVKNGRVHLIDSDLIDRPSPRVIDGLEIMARIIHPEIVWE